MSNSTQPGCGKEYNQDSHSSSSLENNPCLDILSKRLAYEHLLYNITILAVKNDNLNDYLEKCLALLGETLKVSRIYIFEHNYIENTMTNTYEWVAPGISPEKQNLQNLSCDPFSWWCNTLKNNQVINFSDIKDIPDDTAKNKLLLQNIKSILVVPLIINNKYFGYVGFDECITYRQWPQEDVDLLTAIANIITQVIMRYNSQLNLERERQQLLSIFNSITEPIYTADMDTYQILFANKALEKNYRKSLVGEICYKVLQRQDKPCEFCTNNKIKELGYETYRWEHYNPFTQKYYQIFDRMINWPNDRKVRFEMAIDITDRKRVENELQSEKNLLNITLHSIGDGVITTDVAGKIVMVNKVAEELTGWKQAEAENRHLDDVFKIFNENTMQPCKSPITRVRSSNQRVESENNTILISRDGTKRAIADSAAPIKDNEGNIKGIVLVFRDVTEKKKREEAIEYLSYHDSLTGLYNRAFLEKQLQLLDTESNLPIYIIMGDVNGLKITNDIFGHLQGDLILKNIAQILKDSCRSQDIISRWGGDEFVILLACTSKVSGEKIIERIKQACKQVNQSKLFYSISLGGSVKDVPQKDINLVLKEAEEFMYKHKLTEGKKLRDTIINVIQATLHDKGFETREHTDRMQKYVLKIARSMQISFNDLKELLLTAKLHDIGLYAIKDSVLSKRGPLTAADWTEIKKHPEIGYRIAQSIPELASIAEYILHHHEHWDGKGYPQGLKGYDIPLAARIIAVIDAWDTMLNDQIYRKALTYEDAVRELKLNSGSQFDPQIVNNFIKRVLNLKN